MIDDDPFFNPVAHPLIGTKSMLGESGAVPGRKNCSIAPGSVPNLPGDSDVLISTLSEEAPTC